LNKFTENLHNVCWDQIYSLKVPGNAFNAFFNIIKAIFNKNFPEKKVKQNYAKQNPWFNDELRELQKAKRSTYYRFLRKQNAKTKTSYSKIKKSL